MNWKNLMKHIFVVTTAILLASLGLLAQGPLQTSHQPTLSVPAPGSPPSAPAARDGAADKSPLTQIARVNGVVLTQAQLDEEMQRLFPYYTIHGGRVPAAAEVELQQQATHDMVLHELVYQEARRRNLEVPSLAWQKRLQKIRKGFSSSQAYEAAAAKKYGSVATFERRLRRAMLVEQLWDFEVTRKSVVKAQEARVYFQSHKTQYVRPEAVWLQTITIKFPDSAPAEEKLQAHKIAEQILVKAKAAKDYEAFGLLAQQLSQDDWRVMMGDHRWVHRGTVTADIEPAVFSLKPGETSGVVESSTGYMILRANGHQPRQQMPFAEESASIRQRLEMQKREKRSKDFELLLRRNANVEML